MNRAPGRLMPACATSALVLALVAACGSSSQSTASSGGATKVAGTPSRAAAGTPIKIGMIASLTGPQASSNSQGATVAPAWARYVNEQLGGINGHPVQVVIGDDGGDPVKAQAAAQKMTADPSLVAIVVGGDNVIQAYAGAVVAEGVPLVSGTANSLPWYTTPGLFPTTTDVVLSGLVAQVDVAKQFGKAKVFGQLYCAEVAACAGANPILQKAATADGMAYKSLAISASTPSYTAECLKLQQEKVDYAQLNIASAVGAKLISDCQQQGYNPTWGVSEQAIGKDLLDVSDLTAYGPAYAFPSVADSPVVATFRDAMKSYAKGGDWKEGTGSYVWQGLEAVRKAMANVGSNPTRAEVTAGLNSFQGENLGGLLANKVTFTKGKPVAPGSQPCYFIVGIKNGKTVAPDGLTPVCVKSGA